MTTPTDLITEAKDLAQDFAVTEAVPDALILATWAFGISGIIAAAHVIAVSTLAVGGLGIALRYRKKFSPLLRGASTAKAPNPASAQQHQTRRSRS